MDPQPYIGQAMSMIGNIYNIYKSYQTQQYRASVLAGILEIENLLHDVLNELKRIEAMIAEDTLTKEIKAIDGTINTLYNKNDFQAWLKWDGKGTSPQLDDNTIKTILSDNTNMPFGLDLINSAIMGNISTLDPWLKIFLDKTDNSSTNHSKLQLAYAFFCGYLLQVQMRGLTLLAAAQYKDFAEVKDTMNDNFPKQAQKCHDIIKNDLSDKDYWTKYGDINTENYDVTNICYDSNLPDFMAEGCAISGFTFAENGSGELVLELYYGKVDKFGYVNKIESGYSGHDGKSHCMTCDTGNANYINRGFLNTDALAVPPGHVITNIGLNIYESYEYQDSSGMAVFACHGMHLVVKHAPLDDKGSIDSKKVETLTSPAVFNNDDDGNPSGHFDEFRSFNGKVYQSTPLTGIKIHVGDYFSPSGKDDIHKNCFKEKK